MFYLRQIGVNLYRLVHLAVQDDELVAKEKVFGDQGGTGCVDVEDEIEDGAEASHAHFTNHGPIRQERVGEVILPGTRSRGSNFCSGHRSQAAPRRQRRDMLQLPFSELRLLDVETHDRGLD
jgi:hypothetical protein